MVTSSSSSSLFETDYKGYSAVSLKLNRFYVAPRLEMVDLINKNFTFLWISNTRRSLTLERGTSQ